MKPISHCYGDEYTYLLILKDFKYTFYNIDNFDVTYKKDKVEVSNREKVVVTLSYFEADKSYCFTNFKDFSYDCFNTSDFAQELKDLRLTIISRKEQLDMMEERGINKETANYFIHDKAYKINHFKENNALYAFGTKYTYSCIDRNVLNYHEITFDDYLSKSYISKKTDHITSIEYVKFLNEYINNIPLYFIQFKKMLNG